MSDTLGHEGTKPGKELRGLTKYYKLPSSGAHFLKDDPRAFDAPFFALPAREAAATDPEQRLALEVSYRAFENGTWGTPDVILEP